MDESQAVEWYKKAALQGHAQAQFNLGLMYESGAGVPKDGVRAYAWTSLAGLRRGAKDSWFCGQP